MRDWKKWIKAAGVRAVKTVAQTAAATIGNCGGHGRGQLAAGGKRVSSFRRFVPAYERGWTSGAGRVTGRLSAPILL